MRDEKYGTFEPGIASREGGHVYEDVSGTLRANPGDNQMTVYGVSDIFEPQGFGETGIGYWQKGIQTLRAEGENRPSRPSNVIVEMTSYKSPQTDDVKAYGVVAKGNGDAFINPVTHTALTIGGGQPGQGYPCVLVSTHEKLQKSQHSGLHQRKQPDHSEGAEVRDDQR